VKAAFKESLGAARREAVAGSRVMDGPARIFEQAAVFLRGGGGPAASASSTSVRRRKAALVRHRHLDGVATHATPCANGAPELPLTFEAGRSGGFGAGLILSALLSPSSDGCPSTSQQP